MPRVDETSYGAHEFTVDWWRELPEAFRVADRVQGETLAPAWDGLNRDPRFVTGFDGWDRANTSTEPWVVSFTMTRTFKVTPNVPVLVRSWHTPLIMGTTTIARVLVRHTVRDYIGDTIAATSALLDRPLSAHDTWVTPDRFGQLTIEIGVSIELGGTDAFGFTVTGQNGVYTLTGTGVTETTPGVHSIPTGSPVTITEVTPAHYRVTPVEGTTTTASNMDVLAAVHVGTRDVDFDELPDLASFTIQKPYPLLRFMDGVGHQAGFLDDQLAHMWDGDTFDPITAPEQWLRFLGTIMGLPKTYMGRLTLPQLRSHLVAFAENGRPPIGSRRNIAEVAKQWLTGDKQVSVVPATQLPNWNGGEDKQLLQAVRGSNASGKVWISPTAPTPSTEYQWTGTRGTSQSIMLTNGSKTAENLESNPRFEKDLAGWAIARGTIKRDTTIYQTGGASANIKPSTDAGNGWYFIAGSRAYQQATTVTTTMWVYTQVPRSLAVRVWGYNGASTVQGNTVSVLPNTWTPVTVTYPVAPGRTYRPGLVPAAGDTTAGTLWVDRVYTARTEYDYSTYFDGDNQDSTFNDLWVKPGSPNTVYTWDQQNRWTLKTGVNQALIDAVVDAKRGVRSVYTLLMFVRADELPNRDLPAFQKFMQNSGVIPAGHRLVCLESRPTWDQWENAVGPTWNDLESRTKTWTDSESAGVTLDF